MFPADELAIDDGKLPTLSVPEVEGQTVTVDSSDAAVAIEPSELPALDGKNIVDIPVEASEPENVAQFK